MKKVIFGLIAITILAISSCSKPASSGPGGSWSFHGTSYSASTVTASSSNNTLVAVNGSGSSVQVYFYNSLPSANGTYTVGSGIFPSSGTQVGIAATIDISAAQNTVVEHLQSNAGRQQL